MKDYLCCCGKDHNAKRQMIRCHSRHHFDSPECLYDRIGETGDRRIDGLVKKIWNLRSELSASQREQANLTAAIEVARNHLLETKAQSDAYLRKLNLIAGVLNV